MLWVVNSSEYKLVKIMNLFLTIKQKQILASQADISESIFYTQWFSIIVSESVK